MFPPSLRLSRAGFEQSRRLPRTATGHFSISYGTVRNTAGIGIIVPKKVAKTSVQRHQLKRRIREAARLLKRNHGFADMTIVIAARPGAPALSFEEIKDELSGAFKAILPESS